MSVVWATHLNGREKINLENYSLVVLDEDCIEFIGNSGSGTSWFFADNDEAEQCFENIRRIMAGMYYAVVIGNYLINPAVITTIGAYDDDEGWFIQFYTTLNKDHFKVDFSSEYEAIQAMLNLQQFI